MYNPYIDTKLTTDLILKPNEITNIESNLYITLVNKLNKKCYQDIGYIDKIYKITKIPDGCLINEDFSGVIHYKNVQFECRICKPINENIITCKITTIEPHKIALAEHGPLKFLILLNNETYNKKNFIFDNNTHQLYSIISDNKGKKIDNTSYVNVKIQQSKCINNSPIFISLGYLYSIASDEDIKFYHSLNT